MIPNSVKHKMMSRMFIPRSRGAQGPASERQQSMEPAVDSLVIELWLHGERF